VSGTPGASAVVFAYHSFGSEGLAALQRAGVTIRRVFSHRDSPGERIWWRSVAEWCAAQGVPCELDADLKDPAVVARIAGDAPDFLFSFYFRHMIPEAVLALAPRGAFNLHGSLLPKFRGRSPINWQLVHGAERSGLSLHRMVRKPDAGDLVAQQAVTVHPDQDALGLTRQLLAAAPALLDRAIPALVAGTAVFTVQDHLQSTYFGGRKPADGLIDWRQPARTVHNLVRAVAPPWPGAFTFIDGRKLLVWRTAVLNERSRYGSPGTVLGDGSVACGAGAVALLAYGADDETPVALPPGARLMAPSP
jgi:methionyl-tRNA formyltransferase